MLIASISLESSIVYSLIFASKFGTNVPILVTNEESKLFEDFSSIGLELILFSLSCLFELFVLVLGLVVVCPLFIIGLSSGLLTAGLLVSVLSGTDGGLLGKTIVTLVLFAPGLYSFASASENPAVGVAVIVTVPLLPAFTFTVW